MKKKIELILLDVKEGRITVTPAKEKILRIFRENLKSKLREQSVRDSYFNASLRDRSNNC